MTSANEMAPPSWTLMRGEVLAGTYRVVRRLAVGGMAEVYLCRHARLPGYFVAKVLTRDFQDSAESVVRFRREAEMLASLRHPNIVQVFDFNVSERGQPFLIMEFLDGQDLSTVLRPNQPLGQLQVLDIVRQTAAALQSAHSMGIVHRDLKPENILLAKAPGQNQTFVKVIDFGISLSPGNRRITSSEVLMGTPHFMSPEQALGRRDNVDPRSDQFTLASMTYLMLAGQLPFDGEEPLSVLYNVVNASPAPLPAHLGSDVDAVLRKALSKSKADRFDNVIAFSDALEAAMIQNATPLEASSSLGCHGWADEGNAATTPAVLATPAVLLKTHKVRKPRRRGGALLAALSMGVVGLGSWWMMQNLNISVDDVHARFAVGSQWLFRLWSRVTLR